MSKENTLRQRFGYLPHIAVIAIDAIGEEGMLKLVERFGGTRIWLGKRKRGRTIDELVSVIGKEAACKLQAAFINNIILQADIPTFKHFQILQRDIRLTEAWNRELLVSDVARSMGMTERGIYKAIRRLRALGWELRDRGGGGSKCCADAKGNLPDASRSE